MILKILKSRFSATFHNLLFIFLKFFGHFRVNRSSRAIEFFSGLADIILGQFEKQKMVLNIFLKLVFLKGNNFALSLKASRVCRLFDCFCFSLFRDHFVCVLAGIVIQLICWSGKVLLSFLIISLNCISGHVLLCFLFL